MMVKLLLQPPLKTTGRHKVWLHASLTCTAGVTAIEYAIVLPVLLLLILGIVEYSIILYGSSVLVGSTVTAAREGKTGYPDYVGTPVGDTSGDATQDNYIGYNTTNGSGLLQSGIAGLLDPTKVVLTAKSYANFSDIKQPEPCLNSSYAKTGVCTSSGGGSAQPGVDFTDVNGNGVWDNDQGTPGLGGPNNIVLYTATYPLPIIPFFSGLLGTSGVYNITASALVKNEPYGNSKSNTTPVSNPPAPPANGTPGSAPLPTCSGSPQSCIQ